MDFDAVSAAFDVGNAYYNYIDTQKLFTEKRWRTPSERVKIKLDLRNWFQLLNLIKKAYP